MTTAGPNTAGTGANDSSAGDAAWSSPGNITASDNARAACDLADGQSSQYLVATGFGFALPAGSTVDGVRFAAEHRKSATTGTVEQSHAYIVVDSAIQSGATNIATGATLSTVETVAAGGSASSTGGVALTPNDVNADGFGIALRYTKADFSESLVQAQVDRITLTIDYTPPTPPASRMAVAIAMGIGL